MSDKNPQPTPVLIKRLRRAARALDGLAAGDDHARDRVAWKAFANTCLQAAGRLEDLGAAPGSTGNTSATSETSPVSET